MTTAVSLAALSAAAVNLLAGVLGAWCWHRWGPSRAFWIVLRSGQLAAVAVAAFAGLRAATGHRPVDDLFYLYGLLPLALGLVAEQLRLTSAETVLAARDLESSAEVATLPAAEQRALVLEIIRREIAVMALAALVVCFLELRAAATAHGL